MTETKDKLPILLTNGFFLFPKCQTSLSLCENENLRKTLIRIWQEHQGQFLIISSKKEGEQEEDIAKYYSVGTWGKIILDLSQEENIEFVINSLKSIQLEGLERVEIIDPARENGLWKSEYRVLPEAESNKDEKVLNELTEKFVRYLPNILEKSNLAFADKLPYLAMGNLGNFMDFLSQNISGLSREVKQAILGSQDLRERLDYLTKALLRGEDQKTVDKEINSRVNSEAKKEERVYRLRKIISEAKSELSELEGNGKNEIQKLRENLERNPYPEFVKKELSEWIERLETLPLNSPETDTLRQRIIWVLSLPYWQKKEEENKDLVLVQQKLDQEHENLKEIKQRIIEYLAVVKNIGKVTGQIICLVGPPGVGKTSIARSIAEATGREFVKISLGGIRDEAEIRGHRSTYVGAMPGKIIQGVRRSGAIDSLFLLDEIDKISRDSRGDPTSALLEVLDPEQNKKFVDNYLGQEIPYDLSQIMFICTANSTSTIPRPLLDRMEIIRLSSYTEVEKVRIAKKYLIPKNLKNYKLDPEKLIFQEQAIKDIIRHYTWEAGVRELNRLVQKIIRKFILKLLQKKINKLIVTPKNISQYLGKAIYDFTRKEEKDQVGLVNGLAWTEAGGDILPIEVSYFPGQGKLNPTGNLGEVMKESAQVALDYVKANRDDFGIKWELLKNNDIHIHAPEGATPKEGPSAGIALTTAIISALTKQAISTDIGMTGEIDLLGKVLPIGGLREKAIAAHRSSLKTIFVPRRNEKDIEGIPQEVRKDLKIILVSKYWEVWEKLFSALPQEREKNPVISPSA